MLENNSLRNITNITALLYPVTQYTLSYTFIATEFVVLVTLQIQLCWCCESFVVDWYFQ